jgi:hypothetical protein
MSEVLALTRSEPPCEVAHWNDRAVARTSGILMRAVQ